MIGPIVTVGGLGRLPGAPGTYGAAIGLPLAWLLHGLGGFWLLAAGTLAVTALGTWATAVYLVGKDDPDPSEVVVDELAGMLLTLWPLSYGLTASGAEAWLWPWPGWVLGFLLFRFFDIFKPPPVNWAERAPGAIGVMLDDLVAGFLSAVLMFVAAGLAHGWF